jgi:WD40 repeat protein
MIHVEKIHSLTGHRDCVYTVEASDNDAHIFSAGGDGMIVRWNLLAPEEGELIAKLPNSVYAIHYLSKTDQLIAGHNYEGIHLLNWQEKKEIASLKLSSSSIFDIQSFQNNIFIASGDGSLTVVDLEKWMVKRKMVTSGKSARAIAINPVAGEMAIGFSDYFIRIFSLDDYSLKHEFQAHQNSVFTLCFTPDYKFLISGSRDARLKAWDVSSGYVQVEEVVAHLFAINHLAFSPSGKHFVTGSMDKSIKVWDANELKLLKVIDRARHAGHGTSVNKLLWTSFNDQLVSASDDRTLSVWKLKFDSQEFV